MKSHRVFTLFVLFALLLGACNLPSTDATPTVNANAVFTAAAQTVEAKLTENAAVAPTATNTPVPPTNTQPAPTDTPLPQVVTSTPLPVVVQPTSACDAAAFVSDVTVPDNTNFTSGTTFTKTWRLRNAGTCSWSSSYALTFDSGTQMGGPASQPLAGAVAPGATVDISVNLQAPNKDGTYTGVWGLTNPSGARFPVIGGIAGRSFTVVIVVGAGGPTATAGPSPTGGPTPTNDPNAKFAVKSILYSGATVSKSGGNCLYKVSSADITVNKGGQAVKYWWVNGDGTRDSNDYTLNFDSAGTKSVTGYTWTTTETSGWVGIHIDFPNHQTFQGTTLTCS